jgi:hypothetical protein
MMVRATEDHGGDAGKPRRIDPGRQAQHRQRRAAKGREPEQQPRQTAFYQHFQRMVVGIKAAALAMAGGDGEAAGAKAEGGGFPGPAEGGFP